MIAAVFSTDPKAWDEWSRKMGFQPNPDLPICLANLPPEEWIENCKVLPPPAIQRYLDSDDTLTTHTIDMMELAMERDYKLLPPWCITSIRSGTEEDENLAVEYFYLLKDEAADKP